MDSAVASNEYLEACKNGRDMYDKFNLLSFHQPPPTPDFEGCYSVDSDVVRLSAKRNVERTLASAGISVSDLRFVEVFSKKKNDKKEAEPAYMNYFDCPHGVMVAASNFKARDKTAADKRIHPSEAMWYSWAKVAGQQGAKVSKLRAIVRDFVVNESTQKIIWEASKHSSNTREGPERGRLEFTAQDQGFHALLGSVNGQSTMRMLLDHKSDIGYRTVETVILVGDSDDENDKKLRLDEPEPRSFIILLSETRESPP